MSTTIRFSTPAAKGWPAWLPLPANRPDVAGEPVLGSKEAVGQALGGGWFDSSLDLRLGLEVVDLGPVEWLDEWDGAFASA
jgi:hypothetical protein